MARRLWLALARPWHSLIGPAVQGPRGALAVGPTAALVLLIAAWWLIGRAGSQPLGAVRDVRGAVRIERTVEGQRQVLAPKRGDEVFVGDVVRTGPGAELLLSLADGSTVEIGPETVVRLDVIPGEASPVRRLKLQMGGLVAQVVKVANRVTHFEVETPTAVAGVRGTTFAVHVGAGGRTTVYVQEGVVDVTNTLGSVTLSAGQVAESAQQQAPARPARPLPVRHRPGRDRGEDFRLAKEALLALTRELGASPGKARGQDDERDGKAPGGKKERDDREKGSGKKGHDKEHGTKDGPQGDDGPQRGKPGSKQGGKHGDKDDRKPDRGHDGKPGGKHNGGHGGKDEDRQGADDDQRGGGKDDGDRGGGKKQGKDDAGDGSHGRGDSDGSYGPGGNGREHRSKDGDGKGAGRRDGGFGDRQGERGLQVNVTAEVTG